MIDGPLSETVCTWGLRYLQMKLDQSLRTPGTLLLLFSCCFLVLVFWGFLSHRIHSTAAQVIAKIKRRYDLKTFAAERKSAWEAAVFGTA